MRIISAAAGAMAVFAVTVCLCACAIGMIDPLLYIPALIVFVLYNFFPSLKKKTGASAQNTFGRRGAALCFPRRSFCFYSGTYYIFCF